MKGLDILEIEGEKVKENYDVIVVGAGPAGIMTCYELYLKILN